MWEDGDTGGGPNRRAASSCGMGAVESHAVAVVAQPEPDSFLVGILQTLKQQQVLVEVTLKQQQGQLLTEHKKYLSCLACGPVGGGFVVNSLGLMLMVSLYVSNVR